MFSMPWQDQRVVVAQSAPAQEERKEETMEKDDFLLQQIDEFREKAKQLQDLLATRENKARELSQVVYERESKAQELSSVVAAKEKEVQELNEGVAKNVGVIMGRVDETLDRKFSELDRSIDEKLSGQVKRTAESTEEIRKSISEMRMPEVDTSAIAEELKMPIAEVKEIVSEAKDTVANIKEPIENMSQEMTGMKGEILEKIHTEGVQVFRNTRDLIDEQSQKTDGIDEMRKEVKSMRTNVKVAIWFGVVNFVVLVVFVLYSLGVFGA